MIKKELIDQEIKKYLPEAKSQVISEMVIALAEIKGIEVTALGGSYARGCASKNSDVDLGIYYFEKSPPNVEELKSFIKKFDFQGDATITDFYEWGPWVNGGIWLNTPLGEVDFLYRNLDQVNRVIKDAKQGNFCWDFRQQPPYGFFSVMYLADLQNSIPFYDLKETFLHLKEETMIYPEALRQAIIQEHLWSIEFSYYNAKKLAMRDSIYGTVGCMTRIIAELTQVLFALNRVYFISEKVALETIETFSSRPTGYFIRINEILSSPGREKSLVESLEKLHIIIQEVIKLCKPLYNPKYPIE